MSPPVLELAGLTFRAPVTVSTNLVLALQALLLVRRNAGVGPAGAGGWGLALRVMVVAAGVGALKHGAGPGPTHEAARIVSNLALGTAVTVVALTGGTRSRRAHGPRAAVLACGFTGFILATAMWPAFLVVVAYTASVVGLIVTDELAAARQGVPGARRVLAALALAAVAALVDELPIAVGAWIRGVDVAHLVVIPALCLLASAHQASRGSEP